MKRYITLVMAAAVIFSIAACGTDKREASGRSEQMREETATKDAEPASDGKILIAYFTAAENSGVDAVSSASYSMVNDEAVGRLRAIADMIQAETGGELFSIQTSVVYPSDGGELIDYAAKEQEEDARPELTSHIEGLDEYGTIFVGFLIGGLTFRKFFIVFLMSMIFRERRSFHLMSIMEAVFLEQSKQFRSLSRKRRSLRTALR